MSTTLTTNLTIVNIHKDQFLQDPQYLIQRLTDQQIEQLKAFLLDTLDDKDGSPSIGELHIKQLLFDQQQPEQGKFRLAFAIERRFCCSGTEACQQDYIDFNFQLADNNLIAHATYFNWSLNN